jgi:hypothetical protein
MFAGGCWWRSLAIDGGSGTSRGRGSVMRWPGSRWDGAVERPSAFQAGNIPSWRGSDECYALSPVAAGSRGLLLLLSPLLSAAVRGTDVWAACDSWHLGALALITIARSSPGNRAVCCPAQAPPPNPIAAEPDGQAGSVQGRHSRSRSDAGGALERFRLAWTLLRRVRGRPLTVPAACMRSATLSQ